MSRTAETPARILLPQEMARDLMARAEAAVPVGKPQDMTPTGQARELGGGTVDVNGPPDMARLAEMGLDMNELAEIGNSLEQAGKVVKANKVSQVPPEPKKRKPRAQKLAAKEVEEVVESDEEELTPVGIELPQGTYLCSYPIVIISHGNCIVLGYNPNKIKSPMFVPRRGSELILSIANETYKVMSVGASFMYGDNILQVLIIPPPMPVESASDLYTDDVAEM